MKFSYENLKQHLSTKSTAALAVVAVTVAIAAPAAVVTEATSTATFWTVAAAVAAGTVYAGFKTFGSGVMSALFNKTTTKTNNGADNEDVKDGSYQAMFDAGLNVQNTVLSTEEVAVLSTEEVVLPKAEEAAVLMNDAKDNDISSGTQGYSYFQ